MKWFDNWIMKRAERIMQNNIEPVPEQSKWASTAKIGRGIGVNSVGDSLDSPAVRFKMFRASGGTIIETSIYDDHKDRHISGLYVLTNDKNIGEEIGKILTMESLKV